MFEQTRAKKCPVVQGLLLLLFIVTLNAPIAISQNATGTLSGTIRDQSGALIPGAEIEIVSQGRGPIRTVISGEDGGFVAPLLLPDVYAVKVRQPGFKPIEVSSVVIQVGDQVALPIQLQVGGVTDEISVIEPPSLVQESPALGTIINRQFLENLPLNGRTLQSLILVTPGVVTSPVGLFNFRPGQFSVNGQRESTNYFTVDGVSANLGILAGNSPIGMEGEYGAFNALGGTNGLASVDALQEFKIQTSNFAPEFGRTPGAQVSLITRSGTNDFHGTVFGYYRTDALDANDWFANSRGLPKAKFKNYQFGGVLGGPIVKERTFFFGSYEGMRLRVPQAATRDVPTVALKNSVSAPMRALLEAFPVANGRDYGNGFAEFSATWSNPATSDATAIRVDHKLSNKLTLFGRYNDSPSDSSIRGPSLSSNASLSALTTNFTKLHTATFGATIIASSRLTNDIRFNYSRSRYGTQTILDNFGGAKPVEYSVVAPSYLKPEEHAFGMVITGTTASYTTAPPIANRMEQVQIVDTLSVLHRSHEMKFGVDYRPLRPNHSSIPYNLNLRFANQADTINSIVDVVTSQARTGSRMPNYLNLSLFAQDTWKLKSRLTLSYGLRWEFNPPPVEKHGHDIPAVVNIFDPPNTDVDPSRSGLWKTTYNNFAPRFGIAYHINTSSRFGSILRGGVGMFYDMVTTNAGYGYSTAMWPNSSVRRDLRTGYPLEGTAATAPVIAPLPPYYLHAFLPDLKLPYTTQWNVSIDQALGSAQTISMSYVGNAGRRLYRTYSWAPNVRFTGVFLTTNEDYSDYHGLQMQFQRRMSRGLQATASYTWSKAIDTNSGEQDVYGASDFYPGPPALDRGPSDFDVRSSGSFAVTYNFSAPQIGSAGRAILSGWAIDSIFTARSASPIDLFSSAVNFAKTWRPDYVPEAPLYIDDPTAPGGRRVNKAAFLTPINGRHGTLGRNTVRGFAASQLDFTLRRTITVTERVHTDLRLEMFNALNHPNFGNPVNDLANVNFGRSIQMLGRSLGNLNSLYQIGGPRSMQIGLKVRF
jgi:Carboxypeptidase regulatory-like domain/TonB dependent receptor